MARTPMLTRDRVPEHLRVAFEAETASSGGVVATGPGSVMINSPEMARGFKRRPGECTAGEAAASVLAC